MTLQADDMVGAGRASDPSRPVTRTVVHYEPCHLIDPGDAARELGKRPRQLLGLVIARDLDNQFHLSTP